ncbi:MAG: M3 family oligoendopeptidase [Candidatus Heimdallarchaeota archaeon]
MTNKWDLSFIYKGHNDPQIDADLNNAEQLAEELSRYRGQIRLGQLSAHELSEFFRQLETIKTSLTKSQSYGSLLFYQETNNEHYKALQARTKQRSVDISNKLIWATLELNELEDQKIEGYLQDPALVNYHHHLRLQRLNQPYLQSEAVEQVLTEKTLVGAQAWLNFYREYTSTMQFEIELDGKRKKLSPGEIRPLFRDSQPEVREKAIKAYYQKYSESSVVLSHCFNNIWRDHGQNVRLRSYPNVMTVAHLRDQTEEGIVNTMMEVVQKNYRLVHDYFRAKARLMGQGDRLKGPDLLAPVGKIIKYTWEEAKQMVLEAFTEFDDEMGEIAQYLFDHKLIDSEVRKTKLPGAFCAPIEPNLDPLIHLSFNGTPDSVRTIAHEMGHAIHALLAGRKQTIFYYSAPLVVAETASGFSEQILIDKLLKSMTDEDAKLHLLSSQLEDAFVAISRQIMYVLWEKECHEKGAKRNLTIKEMSDIWNRNISRLYGDAVAFLPEQSWNWSSIPHFIITRFYCYAYAFGRLFVLGLYQKYLEEGQSFIPKYKQLLEAGGSKFPVDLATDVGLDIRQPDFWQAGFGYLENIVAKYQSIVKQRAQLSS